VGGVRLGVSLPSPAAMCARNGSVKFDTGFCEARVRPLLNKTKLYETAEHALRNIIGVSERELPDRRLLAMR
jgi:hypothetical protein